MTLRLAVRLHQLAEAVAVDVIHLGEIQQNLLRPFLQNLADHARQNGVADADREPPFEINDRHISYFSYADVHAGAIIL